jgi:D-alanine transaminase
VAKALIVRNELEQGDASLYIEVTRGVASRKHAFPEARISPTVYLTASPFRPAAEHWEHGVRTILVPDIRWARCDIKSVALLPNVLASQAASERGAQEALFIRDGVITEGAHTNVFAVFDGELRTHPATHHILDGISRQVVLELSQALGIPCREFPIFQQELGEADELLITGTTTEIKPVIEVDGRQVGYGRPGPITRKLQQAFRTIVSA